MGAEPAEFQVRPWSYVTLCACSASMYPMCAALLLQMPEIPPVAAIKTAEAAERLHAVTMWQVGGG